MNVNLDGLELTLSQLDKEGQLAGGLATFKDILQRLREHDPNHYLAFISHHFSDIDNRTLAEELGLEVSTIAKWLRRANGFVKARLQESINKET